MLLITPSFFTCFQSLNPIQFLSRFSHIFVFFSIQRSKPMVHWLCNEPNWFFLFWSFLSFYFEFLSRLEVLGTCRFQNPSVIPCGHRMISLAHKALWAWPFSHQHRLSLPTNILFFFSAWWNTAHASGLLSCPLCEALPEQPSLHTLSCLLTPNVLSLDSRHTRHISIS